MDRVKRIWYLSPMRAAKVQASLRIRAVSPEPPLLAHTSIESRGTFRQKTRSLALLNVWACAVKICHDGMLEDTNSLDEAHIEVELHPQGTHCLYTLIAFHVKKRDWVHKAEKVRKNNQSSIPNPHGHLHFMQKTSAKFQNNRWKTVRGIEPTRYSLSIHFDTLFFS